MSRPPLLILLPGLDGTGILFRPLIAELPESIKPIVVTYPMDRFRAYSALLPIVLEALPASEPYILLGESFSGPLAIMAAARQPPNLVGLILVASFITRPIAWVSPLVPIFARAPVFYFFSPIQRLRTWLGGYLTPEFGSLLAEVNAAIGPGVVAARVRDVFRVDVTEAFAECRVPMLYLAGSDDVVVPVRNLRRIQRIRPDIRTVTFDAPHQVLQTHPHESAQAIANFAASLAP